MGPHTATLKPAFLRCSSTRDVNESGAQKSASSFVHRPGDGHRQTDRLFTSLTEITGFPGDGGVEEWKRTPPLQRRRDSIWTMRDASHAGPSGAHSELPPRLSVPLSPPVPLSLCVSLPGPGCLLSVLSVFVHRLSEVGSSSRGRSCRPRLSFEMKDGTAVVLGDARTL